MTTNCVLFVLLVLFYITSALAAEHKSARELYPIRGTYHAVWLIAITPIEIVQDIINETGLKGKIKLVKPTWTFWNQSHTHPLIYELGHEFDCGPVIPSWLRSNFHEFKFEIPFVVPVDGGSKPLNFKYILYEDSTVESVSSRLFYGLDASKANFSTNNETYDIHYSGKTFHATVIGSPAGTWRDAVSYPYFKPYQQAMELPWFGIKGTTSCARHNYDFSNAVIRPVMGSIQVDRAMLGPVYSTPFMPFFGLKKDVPWGAVEIHINFTMSLPHDCNI